MRGLGGGGGGAVRRRTLADALGVPRDGSFKRALAELVDEGVFVARGATTDRFYVLAEDADPERAEVDPMHAELLAVPCTAHEFSDAGHALGLHGKDLGRRKQALGIETFKRNGQWFCRRVEGYGFVPIPRTSVKEFARLSARAARGGRIIGSGRP